MWRGGTTAYPGQEGGRDRGDSEPSGLLFRGTAVKPHKSQELGLRSSFACIKQPRPEAQGQRADVWLETEICLTPGHLDLRVDASDV